MVDLKKKKYHFVLVSNEGSWAHLELLSSYPIPCFKDNPITTWDWDYSQLIKQRKY